MKLNWANRITIARILLIVPFVIFMLQINNLSIKPSLHQTVRYIAVVIFTCMALSDALDGYLARKKGQATTLGAFLDPMADKLLMTCACILLASDRGHIEGFRLPTTVVVLIVGKDAFLLIGFVVVYFITAQLRIHTVLIGKLATVLQLTMVLAVLIAPDVSKILPGWISFLRVLWWSAAGTAILATAIYIRGGSRYIAEYESKNK
jgi:CDP-diacylglycerol--glycerol-3-phosphate 3-phosphatidyltransferase